MTAIEWMYYTLWKDYDFSLPSAIIEKAKEMEKQQIEEAFNFGVYDGGGIIKKYKMSGEQYYNETFKSE